MMTKAMRMTDASSDGVEALDNLLKGSPGDAMKQDVVIVGWEGSNEAGRAWLRERAGQGVLQSE